MKHTRVPTPRTVLTGAGLVVALTAATLTLQTADAAPAKAPDPPTAGAAGQRAKGISSTLGADGAGAYYDAAHHKLIINVTTEAAAAKARAAGAEARVVKHSLTSLDAARATLKKQATIPGTSWGMDPRTNKVVITADRTVRGTKLAQLKRVAAALGDRAVVRQSAGTLRPLIAGGDAIWGTRARCSLGFNVTRGGQPYFLTAGHCTNAVRNWSATQGGEEFAATEAGTFPGDDFGIVKYTDEDVVHPGAVDLYNGSMQAITRAGDPIVGQKVRRSGGSTHVHDGDVTAVEVTANYQEGAVDGLIQATLCAEAGDSGGSLFEGDTALGLTSGGRGECSAGGVTYYQPVREALQKTGAQLG
ncbi:S1 family peptidase [Streptomyces tubercidicus]|uniref:S1 family peptidase n=1 Tax=Streptomyces tubercidicus TaxID=47759 RepID=UPI002E0E7E04|nr:S1 family peptidase [Streptomyces tubercidicus]WSX24855.1 S1 family peptidase [Streptomyces tubercidicus]